MIYYYFLIYQSEATGVTIIPILLRTQFPTLKDYNEWENSKVEPFLTDLKSAILYAKPTHLEEFVIGFCSRRAMGQSEPGLPRSKSRQKSRSRSILDKRSDSKEAEMSEDLVASRDGDDVGGDREEFDIRNS